MFVLRTLRIMSFPVIPKDINIAQNRRNVNLVSLQSRKSRTQRQDVVDLVVSGTQTVSDLTSTSTLTIQSSDNVANAIVIEATNAAGGVIVTSGTGNTVLSSTGKVNINSVDTAIACSGVGTAITISASNAAGGITVSSGTGNTVLSSTGNVNINSVDTAIACSGVGTAITLNASNAAGGIVVSSGTGNTVLSSTGNVNITSANSTISCTSDLSVGTTTNASSITYIRNGASGANCISTFTGTATNVTTALTSALIHGGILECDSSAGAIALTTDTAALIVASLSNPVIGDTLLLQLVNQGINTVTITGGVGVTVFGSTTIAANSSTTLRFRLTNVTAGTEAVRLTM